MLKRVGVLVMLCAAILVTACIDTTTVISVRRDGSGIITETIYLDDSMEAMMKGMMAQFDEEGEIEAEVKEEGDLKIDEYKEKAAKMGKGVSFVSAKEIAKDDGSKGVKVVYAFKDVRALNIDAKPANPMGDEMAGAMGAEASDEEGNDDSITFDFVKGRTPKLIVHVPKDEDEKDEEGSIDREEREDRDIDDEDSEMGLQMVKQMFKGFRIRVMVNLLEGKIQKTNASFVERVKGKDTVTLIDLNFGEIMGNEKHMKQLEGMSKIKDPDKALAAMRAIPGLKVETREKVEISFR
jgi:hypothetical protein